MGTRNFTKLFANDFGLLLVVLIAVALLLSPGFLRVEDSVIGSESYYNLRIASLILDSGYPTYDDLSFSGRNNFNGLGWSFLISGTSKVTGLGVEDSLSYLLIFLGIFFFTCTTLWKSK